VTEKGLIGVHKLKILFLVFYNTNTLVVNPLIYLRFLAPYVLFLSYCTTTADFYAILNIFFIMVTLLLFYNIAYIVNDFHDYRWDKETKRDKRSFVYMITADFRYPLFVHLSEVSTLLVMHTAVNGHIVIPLIILYMSILCSSIIHSWIYRAKRFTILILRYLRVFSLPILIYLLHQPFSKEFLTLVLGIFPLWNHRSYLEYLRKNKLDEFNSIRTTLMSFLILTSPFVFMTVLAHAYNNLEIGVLITLCISTLAIAIIVKVFKHHNPLRKSSKLLQLLGSLGYPTHGMDEKLGLLEEYFIYLLLVIIASAHYPLSKMVN